MRKFAFSMIFVLLVSTVAFSKIVSIPLKERVQKSHLVVIGKLGAVSDFVESDFNISEGALTVEKIFTGNVTTSPGRKLKPGDKLHLRTTNSRHFACSVYYSEGSYGIWILDVEEDGKVRAWYGGPLEVKDSGKVRQLLRKERKKKRKAVKLFSPQIEKRIDNEAEKVSEPVMIELVAKPIINKRDSVPRGLIRGLIVFMIALLLFQIFYRPKIKVKIKRKVED